MRRPIFLIAAVNLLFACAPAGPPSVAKQVRAAEETGDIEALLDIIATRAAQGEYQAGLAGGDGLITSTGSAQAAIALRNILDERKEERAKVESALAAARDGAPPEQTAEFKNALGLINRAEIGAAKRRFYDAAIVLLAAAPPTPATGYSKPSGQSRSADADEKLDQTTYSANVTAELAQQAAMLAAREAVLDPRRKAGLRAATSADLESGQFLIPSPARQGLPQTAEATAVDAVLVMSRSGSERRSYGTSAPAKNARPHIVQFTPNLVGLTVDEISAVEAGVTRLGVVYRYDEYRGSYGGDCEGKAYRVDLKEAVLVSGRSLQGAEPPFMTQTLVINGNGLPCDGWGVAAGYGAYLQLPVRD